MASDVPEQLDLLDARPEPPQAPQRPTLAELAMGVSVPLDLPDDDAPMSDDSLWLETMWR